MRRRAATGVKRLPGLAPTRLLLWFVVLTFLVGLAATNTGNNALYMVWALMLGLLVVSGVVSVPNIRGLEVQLDPPSEVFAGRPFRVGFTLRNPRSWLPRWFLTVVLEGEGSPRLIPYLPGRAFSRGELELILPRRGAHRVGPVHVSSVFPLGFVRKGRRYPVFQEVLVFPQLHEVTLDRAEAGRQMGEEVSRRRGRGQDLHSMRAFRPGDDPRRIHWKQSARTETLIYMEREAEEDRRISVLFDNAVGELPTERERQRFETLVSEAASVAVHYLGRGYQVEVVTRETVLAYASGRRQRHAVLEALATIGPRPRSRSVLVGSGGALELRIGMEGEAAA